MSEPVAYIPERNQCRLRVWSTIAVAHSSWKEWCYRTTIPSRDPDDLDSACVSDGNETRPERWSKIQNPVSISEADNNIIFAQGQASRSQLKNAEYRSRIIVGEMHSGHSKKVLDKQIEHVGRLQRQLERRTKRSLAYIADWRGQPYQRDIWLANQKAPGSCRLVRTPTTA
ncbi:hypothetical protein OE88DRAFT_1352562 [Heliocybe sulcata]|uniref:Uncharacterized protein n=1 Tax=Heliocybe sulcata TaxID=5364 RepID=A0A5C3N7B1_9AGAM|nr:hypothetical protein OE88DRAFT_1352562 [Heliocybe sulcata]